MNCEEYQIRIGRLLDREDDARSASDTFAHLAQCPACREHLHEMQELHVMLEVAATSAAPEERVLFAETRPPIRMHHEQRSRKWMSRTIVGLSLATVALTAALFFTMRQPVPEKIMLYRLPVVIVTSGSSTHPLR